MPRVQLGDDGRVRARAIVDLDGVRRSRERSVFDPLAYLTGSVEVVAIGSVEGSDGEGLIRYESATVGGVSVPKTVAQELLRFYTRTEERPRGFAFDEPFALPAGVARRQRGARRGHRDAVKSQLPRCVNSNVSSEHGCFSNGVSESSTVSWPVYGAAR